MRVAFLVICAALTLNVLFPSFLYASEISVPPSAADLSVAADDQLILKLKSVPPDLAAAFTEGRAPASLGIPSLDALSRRAGASGVRPLFPPASAKQTVDRVGLSRIVVISVPAGTDIPALCREYARDPQVEYAEPNYFAYGGAVAPNDPSFSQQWGMNNTGQSGGTADADIDAPEAWQWQTGSEEIVVAVVDSGCDFDHPDLAGKFWTNAGEIPSNGVDDDGNGRVDDVYGWDFVNNDNWPQDDVGHGTHVAGIAAARTDNGVGVAGVAWNCPIMPVKVLNSSNTCTYSDLALGMRYAVDNGARAINVSIGGSDPSSVLLDAVNYVYDNGGILCVCTHNYDGPIYYPARYDNVIAVGATDHNDDRASWSNFGAEIDVVAPGVSVYSTMWNDSYASWNGTSMATPHVTGTVALLLSVRPDLTFERVKQLLETTAADQVGNPVEDTPGWDQYMGWGRINAFQALRALDEDSDGLPDAWEARYGLDLYANDSAVDGDSDDLTNMEEYLAGTDPASADTDGDGLSDGAEVKMYGTDPLDPDCDRDGLSDGEEIAHSTDPHVADSDGDCLADGEEVHTYGSDPMAVNGDGDPWADVIEAAGGSNPSVYGWTSGSPVVRINFQPTASSRPLNFAPSSGTSDNPLLGYGWL